MRSLTPTDRKAARRYPWTSLVLLLLITACTKPSHEWIAESKHGDPMMRILALSALGEARTLEGNPVACVDALLTALGDETKAIRREAEHSLTALGELAQEPWAELLCRDPGREVAAREFLEQYGEGGASELGQRFLSDPRDAKDLLGMMLAQLGPPGMKRLEKGLASEDLRVVRASVLGLGLCGARAIGLRQKIGACRGKLDEELDKRVAVTLGQIAGK